MQTYTISDSSLYFRFFSWAWGMDYRQSSVCFISFCRLFWGTLFLPVAVISYYLSWTFTIGIVLAMFALIRDHIICAGMFAAVGIWCLTGRITELIKTTPEQRRREKIKRLEEIEDRSYEPTTAWGKRILWFLRNTIGRLPDIFFFCRDSKIGCMYYAMKEKMCPIIRVENPKQTKMRKREKKKKRH